MISAWPARELANLTDHEGSEVHKKHLKEVLGHIEKHYLSDLNQSSSLSGIPTLLGSLIFTLDAAAKAGDIDEYEKIRGSTNSLQDDKCKLPNVKALDPRESVMTEVTNQEYRCFYPDHSFESKDADMPVQVNWYEALAYAAYKRTTLPNRAKADSLDRSISTWCKKMVIARDENQFSLLSAPGLYRSTSPCSVTGRTALLNVEREFRIPRDFVDSGEGQKNNTSWEGPPLDDPGPEGTQPHRDDIVY
jgi:hypothetical protein